MDSDRLAAAAARILTRGALRRDVPGSSLTTFLIGGPIRYLAECNTDKEVIELLTLLSGEGISPRVLGAGSNLLIASSGLSGWVIRLGKAFRGLREISEGHYRAGAASSLMLLSRDLSEKGLSGLEFAGGIPGSLGGAAFMNAGAHGGEMSDIVQGIRLVDESGREHALSGRELAYGYRKSALPEGALVLEVDLALRPEEPRQVKDRRASLLEERRRKQPLTSPSAGSVFKNPSADRSAGFLLDSCGLKGKEIGGAKISEMHANWIVNHSKRASHDDVLALIALCKERVMDEFGVALEEEVRVWCDVGARSR